MDPNHYDRNKNGNKISLIVTKEIISIGLKLAPSNEHDVCLVEDTIDNISVKIAIPIKNLFKFKNCHSKLI
jgi:hypothetical protein